MREERRVYYKVLEKNMKSWYAKFQYELNKTYSINDEVMMCANGYHACENLYELILWCNHTENIKESRFFKCYLGDNVIKNKKSPNKVVSDEITLIEEISFNEVDKAIRNNIDTLIHNGCWFDRRYIASQGYGLDRLINDESWVVRSAVAKQGYGLHILINDKTDIVKNAAKNKLEELKIINII